ncbi:MAG: phage terminase small subunit P27 family [Rhodospirillales bacterium]|nr:phage terminase small subunit P27 family [Rhodospirillales bacterium]
MRGRKPTPTALKVIRGNPGKRRIEHACPEPEALFAPPPDWLAPLAAERWRQLMPELVRWGLFTRLDADSLAAYCSYYALFRDQLAAAAEVGAVVATPSGYAMTNPHLTNANKAARMMQGFGTEFGLSPAARVRLKGTAQGELPLGDVPAKAAGSRWDALDD